MEKVLGVIFGLVVIIFILAFMMALPFMWIWNYAVVAAISVANPINFRQAFWLAVFCATFLSSSSASKD